MTMSRVATAVFICLAIAAWTSGPRAQSVATPGRVAITNVTVIDGTGAAPRDKMMLILDGSAVEYVGRVGERSIPQGAQVHDMPGHFIIPGLIESHTHLVPLAAISRARLDAELDRMLHGGIVTARVMGGDPRLHMEIRRTAEAGSIPSPDIYYAMIVGSSRFMTTDFRAIRSTPPGSTVLRWGAVDASEDIEAVVAQATRDGASAIKMVAELSAPLMRGIADAAHQAGLRAWAHARVFPERPIDTVRAGADGLSHACGLVWQDPDLDASRDTQDNPGSRRTFDPALVDADGPAMRTLFEEMARRGTVFDPTLVLQSRAAVEQFGCTSKLLVELTRAAHRAGVTIAAGTDFHADGAELYPALHQEIELLVSRNGSPIPASSPRLADTTRPVSPSRLRSSSG